MSRAVLILNSDETRKKAAQWVSFAPAGTRLEFKRGNRTIPQNSRLWALLTDVADQLPWHGQKLTPEDYKLIFLDALRRELKQEMRMAPSLDGTGFVPLGTSSSKLTVSEMSDLMSIIEEFGARHGVAFRDQGQAT